MTNKILKEAILREYANGTIEIVYNGIVGRYVGQVLHCEVDPRRALRTMLSRIDGLCAACRDVGEG